MSKERLKRHLIVVENLLRGAGSVLPFWTSANSTAEDVTLIEGSVCRTREHTYLTSAPPSTPICPHLVLIFAVKFTSSAFLGTPSLTPPSPPRVAGAKRKAAAAESRWRSGAMEQFGAAVRRKQRDSDT